MNPRALLIISSDPRTSPRPAEAIRIASGIQGWERVEVRVCLTGPATLMVRASAGELVDGETFTSYLPGLARRAGSILVKAEGALPENIKEALVPVKAISLPDLAKEAASADYVLSF